MEIELIARLQSSRKGETDTAPADIHLRQSRELDGFFTHPHETVKNGFQYPIDFFEPRHGVPPLHAVVQKQGDRS